MYHNPLPDTVTRNSASETLRILSHDGSYVSRNFIILVVIEVDSAQLEHHPGCSKHEANAQHEAK